MSIYNDVVDKGQLNNSYVSKKSTGTQVMAGSLRMLGELTVDGATKLGSLSANTLNITSLTATGTVIANLFSGSGASLTNLPAGNLTGTIANARLASEVMLVNKVQMVTANLTMSAAANLYFAGGTVYYVSATGDAKFKSVIAAGDITLNTNNKLVFQSNTGEAPSDTSAGARISLQGAKYQIGIEANSIWYDAGVYHRFYTNSSTATRTERFNVNNTGVKVSGSAQITGVLEVEGEVKAGGANEFLDPLLANKSTEGWTTVGGTAVIESGQKPTGTNAVNSIKLTSGNIENYIEYYKQFEAIPSEWVTFSMYLFSTTTNKTAQLAIDWLDAGKTSLSQSSSSFTIPTTWSRQRLTAQAPANAAYFVIRLINSGGSGTIIYFSAIQVERGKALSPFKPYMGGESASFIRDGIRLGSGGQINSGYNNTYILKDHANGNVSVSAAGGTINLGHKNTTGVILGANLKTSSGVSIANTEGILYYGGNDIDTRYVKTSGGTISGSLNIRSADSPNLILERTTVEYNSIGIELKNTVGGIHIGGFISATSKTFNIGLDSNLNTAKFKVNADTGETRINDNVVWHAGNDGAGSGLDADTVDGVHLSSLVQTSRTVTAGTGLSGGGSLSADRTLSFDTTWGDARYLSKTAKAADADKLDGIDSESFLRSDANDTFTGTLTLNGKLNITGDIESTGVLTISNVLGEYREGGKLNLLSRISGRIVNKNSDFIMGNLNGFFLYDNADSGRVLLNIVSDDVVPNANGKIMRVSYNPAASAIASAPGFGGFTLNTGRDTSNLNNWSYRAGNRYIFRVVAKIPVGRKIVYASDVAGTGFGGKWLTSQDGTNNWQEYVYIFTTGTSGSFLSTAFFYVEGGVDEAFTWDVAMCRMIGIDEAPDVDRAPSLNVGYKQESLGWGDVYASGKITSDNDIEVGGKLILKSTASPIQSASGNSIINILNASGNMHFKANEGNKTLYVDADTMYFRRNDGVTRLTMNATGITGHDDIVAIKNVTVGGDLVINKTGKSSKIRFQQQTNDEGLIEHYEDNNIARLYFAAGNETSDLDYMAFGSTVDREGAKITAAGRGVFKALTSNEELTVGGTTTFNGNVTITTTANQSAALKIGNVSIGQVSANSSDLIVTGLTQLRFGSSTSFNWDNWAGVKYDTATRKLTIGGPASAGFNSNANPGKVNLSFEGLDDATFDGKVVINPTTTSSISMTDLTKSYLLVGSPTTGLGLDPNEIAFVGGAAYISTIDSNDIVLNTNKTERLRLRITGAKVTGTLEVTDKITASNGLNIPSTKILSIGTDGNKAESIELSHDGTNSVLNYGGKLTIKSNNVDKINIDENGNVGIGVLPATAYSLHVPNIVIGSWVRTEGSTGWYSQTYGGGWYMKDTTWIRAYGGRSVLLESGTLRTDGTLEVGAAAQFSVTPTTLNWRNTIFSDTEGKVSINKISNSAHPLDVKSNGSYQGINIQNTAITDVSGLSFQNADGKYTWHLASGSTENSNLSIYSGLNASLSALPEVMRFNAVGGLWTTGDVVTNAKIMARGGSGLNEAPSVTLAVGDGDTGLDWVSSGAVRVMSNNTETIRSTSTLVTITPPTLSNGHFSFSSSNGRGLRFWNSDNYKISMSATSDANWGGSIASAPTSDYNMYFRMIGSGTRGFVFEGGLGKLAQIHGDGTIHAKTGFRNGNFEIMHNVAEDSLDFIYMG